MTPRLSPPITVRARLVVLAVAVVLVALLAGGSLLVWAVRTVLERADEAAARQHATEVVTLIRAQGADRAAASLAKEPVSGQVTQILTEGGAVIGSSDRRAGTRPLSAQRPPVGRYTSAELDLDFLGEGDWTVVATSIVSSSTTYRVQVAVPIRVQRQTVQTVAVFLLAATPVLLAAVAAAVWLLVGRTLRPVERIRADVAAIDAQRLADRVEVPPTGDEIAALARTMNAMLDRLQDAQRAQRTFVSDASHELRSPLATVSTAAELAATAEEAVRTRLLGTINVELSRLRGLVENLMTLARDDADDLRLTRAEVDLDDMVGAEIDRLRATSPHTIMVGLTPVRTWADGRRLDQALRNLVANADRHAHTTVRLALREDHGLAAIDIDNDGPPIDIDDRERIFERFVRLDESRSRDDGGSGLGLAIARAAARAHGGDVVATDAPDGWCRFALSLPVDDGPAQASP